MDWPILDISYKGNHIICSLMWLASFCQHNVSKVHPCYSTCQNFINCGPHDHTTVCLSVHLLIDTWVIVTFQLLALWSVVHGPAAAACPWELVRSDKSLGLPLEMIAQRLLFHKITSISGLSSTAPAKRSSCGNLLYLCFPEHRCLFSYISGPCHLFDTEDTWGAQKQGWSWLLPSKMSRLAT